MGTPELLKLDDLCVQLSLGRATVYRQMAAGRVPAPIRVGTSVRWRRAEIEAWVAAGCPPQARWTWEPRCACS